MTPFQKPVIEFVRPDSPDGFQEVMFVYILSIVFYQWKNRAKQHFRGILRIGIFVFSSSLIEES